MKDEIVLETSYRIIDSLSLPSVIEKAIYRTCKKKKKMLEEVMKKAAFVSTYCDGVKL